MYRYSADESIVYTAGDLVLFNDSPFACWMERLTLENPEHGIPADRRSAPPADQPVNQDHVAKTMRAAGMDVALIDWNASEPERRAATGQAMEQGIECIINGQLAVGPLAETGNMLRRQGGRSEFGNYLYLPCHTEDKTSVHSTLRLCFLADLLHSIQGELPPHMLIMRSGAEVLPLQTEDHIYHYRAVKQRFMTAMREFRKHRMPNPAESSHFGRWSDCANELLKRRLQDEPEALEEILEVKPFSSRLITNVDG